MKIRFLAGCVLAAALLALGGCMQLHSTTIVNKDGSGTVTMKISLSQSVAEALKEMSELDPDSDQKMPDFSSIDRDEMEKAAKKHGVKITKFSKGDQDGHMILDLGMEFKDLKGLSYVMDHAMGEGGNDGMGIFDAGDGNLVLRSTQYDFPTDEDEKSVEVESEMPDTSDMDPAKMQKMMELTGKLMGAISEMDVRLEITVPGDIVSSNAPQTEGRTSIWSINSSNMMTAGQNTEPEIVFSGKGLKIKPQTD
ncbi:hypothetical protein COW53_09280 [bacterium CG17_big_fil_post_rev_8_21_14_2_50_64_8]|nr:MAG: hypothetical protein COW53_09280 [bacterium CG17_big_fil_post_rev_8_21_14_2_50_64_8]PJA73149.1 MAG: hypothetical protein CO151_14245 [bacterium CG_4_9_14_3_um_filter_65_15]